MIQGINHITFAVHDIEYSFDFYSRVLGMQKVMKSKRDAYLIAGTVWVALVCDKTEETSDYTHIAFHVKKEEYEKTVSALKAYGVQEWHENATEGESFYFKDPSGNKLELHYSTLENRIDERKGCQEKHVMWYI